MSVKLFCADSDSLLAMIDDLEDQLELDNLLPTDEVMRKIKNRTLLGSGNPLYDYFTCVEDKHHGGCNPVEDGWEDY